MFRPVYALVVTCDLILAEAGDPWTGKKTRDLILLLSKPMFPPQLGDLQTEGMEELLT